MSITIEATTETGSKEMNEGDHVFFRRNYKTENGVYALTGDRGVISGQIIYDDGQVMAYIVELDRPRVKGFETLYAAPELIVAAPTQLPKAS